MDRKTKQILFSLLRTAIRGTKLTGEEREALTEERKSAILLLAKRHDVLHLVAVGLKENGLLPKGDVTEQSIFKALYRYERQKYDYDALRGVLSEEKIPFMPLKGAILRALYPEPWMRTGCDIDVLVHPGDLARAGQCLAEKLSFTGMGRGTHDVTLASPTGTHLELHFDLVEEDVAAGAHLPLGQVWDHAYPRGGDPFFYEMTPAYFMLYHISHMAKHFEHGGCGIRPLLDLYLLKRRGESDPEETALLEQAGLLTFAQRMTHLSRVWFDGAEHTDQTRHLEDYLLCGGMYGTTENRVLLHRAHRGGRVGYLLSRAFVPISRLKRYFPVLEKRPYLMPLMQVRRWFLLLRPEVLAMAKSELSVNQSLEKDASLAMHDLLKDAGLDR